MKLTKTIVGITALAFTAGMFMLPMDGDARGFGNGRGMGGGQQAGMSTIVKNLPVQDLSATEEIGISKMREEEKLARDVYQVLYAKWKLQSFSAIAGSEQRHMDSVKLLLDKYNMVDPAADTAPGVFGDQELQELYNSLIEQGQKSLVEALKVGATIEDLDIKDLYDLIEETDNTDIQTVYQNLVKGSRNHMRTFINQLSMNNATYEAQFLTADQIDDIVTSPRERGRVDENGDVVQMAGQGRKGGKGLRSGGFMN